MGSTNRWEDTIEISKINHVRSIQIKKRAREERKLERVGQIAVLTETRSRFSKTKVRENVSMLAKFEISCLVGTHTLLYTEI